VLVYLSSESRTNPETLHWRPMLEFHHGQPFTPGKIIYAIIKEQLAMS
jgi:hypothetical protein